MSTQMASLALRNMDDGDEFYGSRRFVFLCTILIVLILILVTYGCKCVADHLTVTRGLNELGYKTTHFSSGRPKGTR